VEAEHVRATARPDLHRAVEAAPGQLGDAVVGGRLVPVANVPQRAHGADRRVVASVERVGPAERHLGHERCLRSHEHAVARREAVGAADVGGVGEPSHRTFHPEQIGRRRIDRGVRRRGVAVHHCELGDRAHHGHRAAHDAGAAPRGERDRRGDERAEAEADELAAAQLGAGG
jgi:hypothetical protein